MDLGYGRLIDPMNFYPTTTAIKRLVEIERDRMLPAAGEISVRVGQDVNPTQIVARTKREQGFTVLNGSELLGVAPDQVSRYLTVEEGATVRKGEPLLLQKGRFGRKKQVVAPFSGILGQVRHGFLLFQRRPRMLELRAMLSGTVSQVIGNRGVRISTMGTLVQGVWGSGREGYGQIRIFTSSTKGVPSENEFHDARGAIVVAGHLPTEKLIEAAEEYGARGFIVGSVTMDVYLTARNYSIPVLVTDGVGQRPMTKPIYALLNKMQGEEACILARPMDGHRPEMIIPRLNAVPDVEELPLDIPLSRGQRVRILQAPHHSKIGTVVHVFSHPRSTAIGLNTSGANVALADGQIIFVPKNNLDIII